MPVNRDTAEADLVKMAREDERVMKKLDGKEPKKVIFVKNRLVNFVV
jgi:leucyl-tRNA synthetase